MAEIKLAECAGFCFGVKRAVDTVYEQAKTGKTIYTYGPIVHNDEVVRELEKLGVSVIESEDELRKLVGKMGDSELIGKMDFPHHQTNSGIVIVIRAHGVPKYIHEIMNQNGVECVDATCPFVKRIHKIVEKESMEGKHILILGNPGHPEVEGIRGWCSGPVDVLETEEEALKFTPQKDEKLCVVAQTTFNYNKFQHIVEIFEKKGYNDSVVNTICNATKERQEAAKSLAKEADVMIVIGGKHSSNTRKLFDICSGECEHTYFLETLDDLHLEELPKSIRLVGITAGASTPNKLIEEVQNYVRINF